MKKVILIGTIDNSNELKMSQKNLEILEYTIDDIKVKSFGKLAVKAKDLKGLVVADGSIQVRPYTNQEGKTYNIQEILISSIEALEVKETDAKEVDNFDIKPEDFSSGKSSIPAAKEIEIDPEELPFY